jgi:hypothetical protein
MQVMRAYFVNDLNVAACTRDSGNSRRNAMQAIDAVEDGATFLATPSISPAKGTVQVAFLQTYGDACRLEHVTLMSRP